MEDCSKTDAARGVANWRARIVSAMDQINVYSENGGRE